MIPTHANPSSPSESTPTSQEGKKEEAPHKEPALSEKEKARASKWASLQAAEHSLEAERASRQQAFLELQVEEERRMALIDEKCEDAPLDLGALIMRGFLTQTIRISDSYFVTLKTRSAGEDILVERISQILQRNSGSSGQEISARFTNMAALALSITNLCGVPGLGHSVTREKVAEALKDKEKMTALAESCVDDVLKLMSYPPQILSDLQELQMRFYLRVRKVVSTSGYVSKEVGNS